MQRMRRALARIIVTGCLGVLAAGAAHAATIDVTVVNASARDLDGVYLAPSAQAGWGPDQIDGDILAQNESLTIRGIDCAAASIVVVAEDLAGCFAYQTIGCGGNATWTITSATPRDCGH